jgi:hypothetical protein
MYYTWKCHNETPCVAILNNRNVFSQKELEGKTGPFWELVPVEREDRKKG